MTIINMLKVITYNCQGLKNSLQDVSKLCQHYDFVFLQETWLFNFELHMLSSISKDFEGFGISAIDDSLGIVNKDGLMVAWRFLFETI